MLKKTGILLIWLAVALCLVACSGKADEKVTDNQTNETVTVYVSENEMTESKFNQNDIPVNKTETTTETPLTAKAKTDISEHTQKQETASADNLKPIENEETEKPEATTSKQKTIESQETDSETDLEAEQSEAIITEEPAGTPELSTTESRTTSDDCERIVLPDINI